METFSALLALCAGNSPVTGEFPSQRASNADFDVKQTVEWPGIWDHMTFMWRHRTVAPFPVGNPEG